MLAKQLLQYVPPAYEDKAYAATVHIAQPSRPCLIYHVYLEVKLDTLLTIHIHIRHTSVLFPVPSLLQVLDQG